MQGVGLAGCHVVAQTRDSQPMTHSADNVPNCARAVELVVAGPYFVEQCWSESFLAGQLQ